MKIPNMRIRLIMGVVASLLLVTGLTLSFFAFSTHQVRAAGGSFYQQTNLVSDQSGVAHKTDSNLVNAWGLAYGPQTPFWVANNGTGTSTIYDSNGNALPPPPNGPLVVTVPAAGGGSGGTPTGLVFNGTSSFVVSENGKSGSALFIFATEDGTISGWNPNVDPTHAVLAPGNFPADAVYKGLARVHTGGKDFLFATNFHAGVVDVYDANFKWVKSFTDSGLPAGYAPFGIRVFDGRVVVTFALQDADKHDDVAGAGHGFVDIFDTNGKLQTRLISHGVLNSPWGLALSPGTFGPHSHQLLVGNFGDGTINAFNSLTGAFMGTLKDKNGNPIVIDGLWSLTFGNGTKAGAPQTLFFTAGPDGESHGLFGKIQFKG